MSKSQAAKKAPAFAAVPLVENIHDDSVMFKVRDPAASAGNPRKHVLLDENKREVPFNFLDGHGYIDCPYRYAIQFARIPEFEVLDNHGRRIRAVEQTPRVRGIQLNNNEVIAELDELTTQSLMERANKAGGSFKGNASRASLITFLSNMAGLKIEAADSGKEEEIADLEDEDGEVGETDLMNED